MTAATGRTTSQRDLRCGVVALLGAPNAGKSTLMNALVGTKLSIVTHKVQTTRARIRGVAIEGASQIIFVDTPGIFRPKRRLERAMVSAAWAGARDADEIVVLCDAARGVGEDVLPYFPVSLIPLMGGAVGLFFGVLIGFVSTRRAGTTFAMISLGFAEMATALTLIIVTFFNGEEGIQTDRWVGPEPFGITFGSDVQVYYLIGVWCLIATAAMYALTRTPFGRSSSRSTFVNPNAPHLDAQYAAFPGNVWRLAMDNTLIM